MAQRLERILEIDRQVRAGEYPTARSLADDLGVSERIVYYDIAFMRKKLRAPLEFARRQGGYHYTEPTWVLPSTYVTEGELLAFFLGVELAQRYLGTAFEAPLRSAIAKIRTALKSQRQIDLGTLQRHSSFGVPAPAVVDPQLLLDLYRAADEKRQVRIRYFTASRGEWTERVVYPYHLYNLRGDWYLAAYDRLRNQMRNFSLGGDRIAWWKVLDKHFLRRPDFSPEEWMQTAFATERGERSHRIAIHFDEYQTRWIRERQWHETQELELLPNGGSILRFEASGLGEVKRWVMGYGSHAEVLEPEELRAMVSEEFEQAGKRYRKEDPS